MDLKVFVEKQPIKFLKAGADEADMIIAVTESDEQYYFLWTCKSFIQNS